MKRQQRSDAQEGPLLFPLSPRPHLHFAQWPRASCLLDCYPLICPTYCFSSTLSFPFRYLYPRPWPLNQQSPPSVRRPQFRHSPTPSSYDIDPLYCVWLSCTSLIQRWCEQIKQSEVNQSGSVSVCLGACLCLAPAPRIVCVCVCVGLCGSHWGIQEVWCQTVNSHSSSPFGPEMALLTRCRHCGGLTSTIWTNMRAHTSTHT